MIRLIVVAFIGFYGYQCMTSGCGNITHDINIGSYKDSINSDKADEILRELDSKAKQAIKRVVEGVK